MSMTIDDYDFHGPVYVQGYGWSSPTPGRMRSLTPVGVDGKPVKHTKTSHPYSYDAFVLVRFRANVKGQHGVYTDRMQRWDDVAWRRAMDAVKTDGVRGELGFSSMNGDAWRRFFEAYYPGQGFEIVVVEESCNMVSGYPVWCVIFTEPECEAEQPVDPA